MNEVTLTRPGSWVPVGSGPEASHRVVFFKKRGEKSRQSIYVSNRRGEKLLEAKCSNYEVKENAC